MVESAVLNNILVFGPVFLLIAARAFAMIQIAPLLSSEAVPITAKFALAGLVSFAAIPSAEAFFAGNSSDGFAALTGDLRHEVFGLRFALLLMGEAVIGIIIGFYMVIIFATFSTAGQFFSLQMGFGASETFDPVAQIENPLMGQYFNLVSMLIFVTIGGFHQLFLGGFWRSVQTINIVSLIEGREPVITMVVAGLSRLFFDAIIISLPIMGTLFLTSLTVGMIGKAAPQINILSEGFPISIMTAFIILFASLPFLLESFVRLINAGFADFQNLYIQIGRQITGGRF